MKNQIKNDKSVLILTHWSYNDALVQTYTLPYVKIIRSILPLESKIIIVTSEQPRIALSDREIQEINIELASENMELIATKYLRMSILKLFATISHIAQLFYVIRKERIKYIHCFCTPAGSIGYVLSKLTGADLIIDSYEPHAESMVENGTWKRHGLPFQILYLMEKLQTHHAKYLIGTSGRMLNYAKEKYRKELRNFFAKPACVDLKKFNSIEKDYFLAEQMKITDKIVCVYAGKIGGIYLKEEVFDFLKECHTQWGKNFRFLMLTDASRDEVLAQLRRVSLPEEIVIQKYVTHDEIPRHLSTGTFGLNPVKPVPTKRYCTSIKDGEYWAAGLPVVITKDISDDSAIIMKNNIGYVLNELSATEYRSAINKINQLAQENQNNLRSRIKGIAKLHRSLDVAKNIYTKIYS